MSRGLGATQRKVLEVLAEYGPKSASLHQVACLVAGVAEDRWHFEVRRDFVAPPAIYSAVARAVVSLERRGLVTTKMHGSSLDGRVSVLSDGGCHEWKWRHIAPARTKTVRLSVESLDTLPKSQHITKEATV